MPAAMYNILKKCLWGKREFVLPPVCAFNCLYFPRAVGQG